MHKLKAQGWQIEEITKLFLVLIIGLLIAVFIINASGSLSKLIDEFCAKYPAWCGGASQTRISADYAIAKASVEALVTAINCVADPETCQCREEICTFSPETYEELELTGSIISYEQKPSLSLEGISNQYEYKCFPIKEAKEICSGTYTKTGWMQAKFDDCKSPPCKRGEEICCARVKSSAEPSSPETDKNKNTIEVKCEQIISGYICRCDYLYVAEPKTGDFTVTVKTEKPIEEANKPTEKSILEEANKKCRKKAEDEGRNIEQIVFVPECEPIIKTTCDVKNFQLPQKVSKAKEWIAKYGDPQFIVYWQNFPLDQDTWTFKADWKIFLAITALTLFPPTKVANSAAKLGLTAVKQAAKRATAAELKTILKEEAKNKIKNIIIQRLKNQKIRTVLKGTTLTLSAYVAELYDSMNAKYQKTPNKVVLKTPFKEPEKFTLISKLQTKPVLIVWDPDILTKRRTAPAHIVSPCYLDTLKVTLVTPDENNVILCDGYTYHTTDGSIECIDAYEKSGDSILNKITGDPHDKPLCNIEKYFNDGNPYTSSITKLTTIKTSQLARELEKYYIIKEWIWDENSKKGGDWIEGIHSQNPEKIKIISKKDRERQMILDDTVEDGKSGYFDTISLKECRTEAVIIEIPKNAKKDVDDSNYCVDDRGNVEKVLKIGGTVVGVGALLASGFFSGGSTWLLTTAAIGGTIAAGTGEIMDYKGQWP